MKKKRRPRREQKRAIELARRATQKKGHLPAKHFWGVLKWSLLAVVAVIVGLVIQQPFAELLPKPQLQVTLNRERVESCIEYTLYLLQLKGNPIDDVHLEIEFPKSIRDYRLGATVYHFQNGKGIVSIPGPLSATNVPCAFQEAQQALPPGVDHSLVREGPAKFVLDVHGFRGGLIGSFIESNERHVGPFTIPIVGPGGPLFTSGTYEYRWFNIPIKTPLRIQFHDIDYTIQGVLNNAA